MCSSAEGWHGGERRWRIAHDAQKAPRDIECVGELPAAYAAALAQAKVQQDAEDADAKEVDFYFEIPLHVAKSFVAFKHDEESAGIDFDKFTVIERSGRSWWQFWK